MNTFVALLRAVNVGGTGKLPMASFRKLLQDLGFENVQTYIQSGNAVFNAKGARFDSAAKVAKVIGAELEKLMSAPCGVMVRTHNELERVIAENPFAEAAAADGSKVHGGFLAGNAGPGTQAALQAIVDKYPARRDRFHLVGDTLYLHLPNGAAETKFSGKGLDKALGVPATGRNWNTVLKLHAMSAPKKP